MRFFLQYISAYLLCRCYVAATLAIMIIPSSYQLLDESVQMDVCTLMESVLSRLTPTMLEKYEDQEGLVWCSILPYVKLFYLPTSSACMVVPMLRSLQLLSLKVLLLMLHGTLRRKVHCDVVSKEEIRDYVISLPWVVPAEMSQAASALVSDFAFHQALQPPMLVNIVKGKLARWGLGLDAVVSTSVRDIVTGLSK